MQEKYKTFFVTTDSKSPHVVHYTIGDYGAVYGSLYPIETTTEDEFVGYISNTSCDSVEEFKEEKVKCLFDFSFQSRGIWEGRIYMKSDEYWMEDLKEMGEMWDAMYPRLKEIVMESVGDDFIDWDKE